MVGRMDRQGEVLILCRKVLGLCEAKTGTNIEELLQSGASRHQRVR